jgi:hypothetical protein
MLIGLPFAAFIEAFFLLSQRKFPNTHNLFDSVNQLLDICLRHLHSVLQTSTSPLTYQSNQSLLHRPSRNNNITSSSSLNVRPPISTLRSSTSTSVHRSMIVPPSTSLTKDPNHQPTPSDDKTKQDTLRQSTKSVFPLFFDVL